MKKKNPTTLFFKVVETVVHASLRLDWTIVMLNILGLSVDLLSRSQLALNLAARLLTGPRKYASVSPAKSSLLWLTVKPGFNIKPLNGF